MTGCNTLGSRVWYSTSTNPARKLKHSLELVETDDQHLVCVNTARANKLVAETLTDGRIDQIPNFEQFRSEFKIPDEDGRFDFGNKNTVLEVKSVTWGARGVGRFPDAPSVRATRHVRALHRLADQGYNSILFFAALHTGIESVMVASEIDSEYGLAMTNAIRGNVKVVAYRWKLSPTEMTLDREIEFYPSS